MGFMEKNADSDTSKLLIKLKDAPKPILFLWIIFVSSIDIPLIIIFDERIITPSEDFSLILVMIVCFVISFFFNFLIHELSHFLAYLFFNIPAKMSLTECKAFSKCFVWQYKYICLAPLLSWIVLQTITTVPARKPTDSSVGGIAGFLLFLFILPPTGTL